MPALSSFDYAAIRVVPRVEREEFINAGVLVFCRMRRFLEASIELDLVRLHALAPTLDQEEVSRHLAVIPVICRGGTAAGALGLLNMAERFHWLVSPRSTIIQTSPVHCGLCSDPQSTLERLMDGLVRLPAAP